MGASVPSAGFGPEWWLRAFGGYLATSVIYGLLALAFGWTVALVCGLLFIAFALGLFYGAGTEIMKQEAAQAIEARRAETPNGSVHESATPNRDPPDDL